MNKFKGKYDPLELARIVGEPVDPRKPYPDLINAVCDTDTADPDEYYYSYDVLDETDKVYVVTSTGEITQENVTPDTPTQLSFADIVSPEYWVKLTELAKAKERTLARKTKTINRAMNAYENYNVLTLIDAAVPVGNQFTLRSGNSRFDYKDLVLMINAVTDYADQYVLIAGTQIDLDIKLWNFEDNKNQSLSQALEDLNVTIFRQFGSVTIDGGSTSILSSTVAYLVGLQTEAGRPVLFVRKRLDDIDLLGGAIFRNGDKPQRIVYVSPNPIHTTGGSTKRYLGVGITGYEEYAAAVINSKAIAKFTRS